MNCDRLQDVAGRYLDGELPAKLTMQVEAHAKGCTACTAELLRLRELIARLEAGEPDAGSSLPATLWPAIERHLDQDAAPAPPIRASRRTWRRPLALAASIALMFGAASTIILWTNLGAPQARATVIDYSLLLDGLTDNVDAALDRFLTHYGAVDLPPTRASVEAPRLRFRLPEELPGGYRLDRAWRLDLEGSAGIAARYRRDDEPLVVFFHAPTDQTRTGVHTESHCQVAGREGQCVTVGPWRLLHFTDPTTCHCLLSRIDSPELQRDIFAALAPDFARYAGEPR